MLADVENNEHYKVVSADSNAVDVGTNELYFLIDLECSTNVCNYNDNFYLLSFYGKFSIDKKVHVNENCRT